MNLKFCLGGFMRIEAMEVRFHIGLHSNLILNYDKEQNISILSGSSDLSSY